MTNCILQSPSDNAIEPSRSFRRQEPNVLPREHLLCSNAQVISFIATLMYICSIRVIECSRYTSSMPDMLVATKYL